MSTDKRRQPFTFQVKTRGNEPHIHLYCTIISKQKLAELYDSNRGHGATAGHCCPSGLGSVVKSEGKWKTFRSFPTGADVASDTSHPGCPQAHRALPMAEWHQQLQVWPQMCYSGGYAWKALFNVGAKHVQKGGLNPGQIQPNTALQHAHALHMYTHPQIPPIKPFCRNLQTLKLGTLLKPSQHFKKTTQIIIMKVCKGSATRLLAKF